MCTLDQRTHSSEVGLTIVEYDFSVDTPSGMSYDIPCGGGARPEFIVGREEYVDGTELAVVAVIIRVQVAS